MVGVLATDLGQRHPRLPSLFQNRPPLLGWESSIAALVHLTYSIGFDSYRSLRPCEVSLPGTVRELTDQIRAGLRSKNLGQ